MATTELRPAAFGATFGDGLGTSASAAMVSHQAARDAFFTARRDCMGLTEDDDDEALMFDVHSLKLSRNIIAQSAQCEHSQNA